jgi:signal transduction histidine kinase
MASRAPGEHDDRAALEAIAAGIAHEVRNPLNALQINLSILAQEISELVPDRGSHVFEVLGKIAGELRSLDDFVTEFLRYAGPPRLRPDSVAVRALLEDLESFISPECARKGVTLSLAPAAGPERVVADAFQLKHALLNLVLNAVQATPPGGSIAIATGGNAGGLEITVRDSGEGMPPDVLARVFDAFFTTREGGTGLGLPIARRIVEAHGGALVIDSREGAGTLARLWLPAGDGR